ncbi:hypothetical protein PG997_000746 [Apiospora hydei]|uniref:Uncharacterized protein n=1 Tax=Apiospora hydei TaxID=1337664 RepID=A0ABR1XBN9_9PEZI
MSFFRSFVPLSVCAAVALAAPAPEPVAMPHPMVTAAPVLPRDFEAGTYVASLVKSLGSGVSSYVVSGIPQYFQDFPTGDKVKKSLGIDDDDLKATPTQVLNVPAYANWTDEGWNVRVHGNVYKQPNTQQDKVDKLANQDQARNVTRSIYVVQQAHENVTVHFENDVSVEPDASGGVINAKGGAQVITLPYETTVEGDFDTFVKLKNTTGANGGHMMAGNATKSIQSLNMYVNGTTSGNATAYLVPPTGFTIISDIDDILRITKIYIPKEGLLNSFARPFTPG